MPSSVLQTPQILSLQGSVLRIAHPDVLRNLRTELVSESAAAATSLTVADNNGFFNRDFPAANLVGYWAFDEGSGATAQDGTVNNNDGAITGAVYVPGISSTALDFDGVNDFVAITDNAVIQNIWDGGGAISVWINPDSDGEQDAGRVLTKDSAVADSPGWSLRTESETGSNLLLNFRVRFTGPPAVLASWVTAVNIPINVWTHVCIVYNSDSINNNPIIYINGISVPITEATTPVGVRNSDIGSPLYIGNEPTTVETFDGTIDEVHLYSAEITARAALALYNNQYVILGEPADARTEETNVNGGAARTTTIAISNSAVFAHEIHTPVTQIQERAIRIYGAATDGGAGTLIESVGIIDGPIADAMMIQWSRPYTEWNFLASDTEYAFYYALFTDGITNSATSTYIPAAGFVPTTTSVRVINIIEAALNEVNAKVDGEKITYPMLLSWANDWQDAVKRYVTPEGIKKDWTFEFVTDNTSITLTENENEYSLAGLTPDLKYTMSHEAILNVRIGSSEPLQFVDLDQFDKDFQGKIRDSLAVASGVGATSITLVDSTEFSDSGSVVLGPDTLTYTANNRTTNVLSGIPAAGANSITVISAIGAAVWQGVTAGTAGNYTIRSNRIVFNIPAETDIVGYPVRMKYISDLARFTSISQSVSIIPFDHGKYYIAARIEERKGNTQSADRMQAMFELRLVQEAIKDGLPILEAQTYYTFHGGIDGGLVGELS